MKKTLKNEVSCNREGCGHKEYQHDTSGRCLSCLSCFSFQYWVELPEIEVPEYKMLTTDEFEGLKNEVSYANSRIEELEKLVVTKEEKYAACEKLRRDSQTRESVSSRSNFELLRQKAVTDRKLEAALDRIAELEDDARFPEDDDFEPPLLHPQYLAHDSGHDDSTNLHRHRDGVYEQLGMEVSGPIADMRQAIEQDQQEQAESEWERLRTYGEE